MILTQRELTVDLSMSAMEHVTAALKGVMEADKESVQCEIDNFCNTLLNLIERGVGREPTDEELCS